MENAATDVNVIILSRALLPHLYAVCHTVLATNKAKAVSLFLPFMMDDINYCKYEN